MNNTLLTTPQEKVAFIKANKQFVAEKISNATLSSSPGEKLDALVAEILAHPDFTEPTPATAEKAEVIKTEEYGDLLKLVYAGRSRNGFKFAYGDKFVFTNDSRLFAIEKHLVVGETVMPFKADSLESFPWGFAARLNYSASELISEVNNKVDQLQNSLEQMIRQRMLLLKVSRKEAEAHVHGLYTKDMDEKFKASLPQVDLF